MRIVYFVSALLLAQLSWSQLSIQPIAKPSKQQKARKSSVSRTVNPATLPFWDDFSITNSGSPDSIRIWGTDTTRQWNFEQSKNVFVNGTLAINPPSYRVATFDGLDANGAPYGTGEGETDQLMSDTINLFGKADVVLSFYWQAGGNVELAEREDSLKLEFYAGNNQWDLIWAVDGREITEGQDTTFIQEAIPLDTMGGKFLREDFVFRFQAVGDQDGPFDAWHLDWIYMNDNRDQNEAITEGYDDAGFAEDISSPFTPFSSIPVNQLTNDNKYIQDQKAALSYLNELPRDGAVNAFEIDISYRVELKNTGELILNDNSRPSDPLTSDLDYDRIVLGATDFTRPDEKLNEKDFSSLLLLDSAVIEAESFLILTGDPPLVIDPIDFRINDTIRTQYLLHNFYAYDDGTAEFAAGINVIGGQVAVQYWLEEPDTLTHVDIYFPNIDPPSGNQPLTLNIFKELEDESEPVRSQSILIRNGTSIDAFERYPLARPIVLSDTFFVSYQQSTNSFIGVGFDRSNVEAGNFIFENRLGTWARNQRLAGALMIRPVFASIDSTVTDSLITHINPLQPLTVYPNPTSGSLTIDGSYLSISLMDFSGRIWLQEQHQKRHELESLPTGLYLLTIHRKEGDQTLKIIKE